MTAHVTLGKLDEFRSGVMRSFSVDGQQIAIARVSDRFYAFSNICTHRYEYMTEGFIQGNEVVCAVHEAEFNMTTGEAVGGPAIDPLPVFPVRVVEDELQIEWPHDLAPESVIADYHDDQDDFARQFII